MVKPSERRLNKKFVRVPSGKTKVVRFKASSSKPACGICKSKLQGTPRGKSSVANKLSKTEKRPSIIFGGVLCNTCRDMVFEEAIKVKSKKKDLIDVKVGLRKYIKEALGAINI